MYRKQVCDFPAPHFWELWRYAWGGIFNRLEMPGGHDAIAWRYVPECIGIWVMGYI